MSHLSNLKGLDEREEQLKKKVEESKKSSNKSKNSFVLVIGQFVGKTRRECGYELRGTVIKLLSIFSEGQNKLWNFS